MDLLKLAICPGPVPPRGPTFRSARGREAGRETQQNQLLEEILYDLLNTMCPVLMRCGNATVVINSSNINTSPVEDMSLVDSRVFIHSVSELNICIIHFSVASK